MRIIVFDIFLLVIPLSHIYETIVEVPSLERGLCDGGAAMPRDIRDLISVIGIRGIREVLGLLIGVLYA